MLLLRSPRQGRKWYCCLPRISLLCDLYIVIKQVVLGGLKQGRFIASPSSVHWLELSLVRCRLRRAVWQLLGASFPGSWARTSTWPVSHFWSHVVHCSRGIHVSWMFVLLLSLNPRLVLLGQQSHFIIWPVFQSAGLLSWANVLRGVHGGSDLCVPEVLTMTFFGSHIQSCIYLLNSYVVWIIKMIFVCEKGLLMPMWRFIIPFHLSSRCWLRVSDV